MMGKMATDNTAADHCDSDDDGFVAGDCEGNGYGDDF